MKKVFLLMSLSILLSGCSAYIVLNKVETTSGTNLYIIQNNSNTKTLESKDDFQLNQLLTRKDIRRGKIY